MDDISKYSQLSMVEFLEFIARLAVLMFNDYNQMLLLEKIEKVLIELLKVVSEKIKYPPKTDDDEMVSDFDDDIL